ncbi:MAG: GNAT family N-acetyltransferase [Alphaproteobacteria bacterium]|nr:GNAT family N-acetyltransferase [Alphaproteobacteria bacterium]
MTVAVQLGDPRTPGATALLQASHALMEELFPSESNHYLSVNSLCTPDIRFFTATEDENTLGCAALALKDGYGEVKSMYVVKAARGKGVADLLMRALEQEALAQGLRLLRLETGHLLKQAHALYSKHGYFRRGPFGDYPDDPLSLFMEKPLRSDGLIVRPTDPLGPEGRALLADGDAAIRETLSAEECLSFSPEELSPPGITFYVAWQGTAAVGCVALCTWDGYAEVKRLFVPDNQRGNGIAAALMDRLEAEALAAALPLVRLETAHKLTAAVELYKKRGYRNCPVFGKYTAHPSRIYMKKPL